MSPPQLVERGDRGLDGGEAGADVFFDGEDHEDIENGSVIFLGVLLYNPSSNNLEIRVNRAYPPDEAARPGAREL